MTPIELRDPDVARTVLSQGLWFQRVVPPSAATVRPALERALEVVAAGQPLPPIGFVGDLGNVVFELGRDARGGHDLSGIVGLPPGLIRAYEDLVLGKFYTDWTFDRASDVLRHLGGRDRHRGLAFVISQFMERGAAEGIFLSPAVIKSLLETPPDEVLARGWGTLARDGLTPLVPRLYEGLIAATRRLPEVLAPEDVFELEHGTALAQLGQRVALRQVLEAARRFEAALPAQRVRPRSGRREVPTHIHDEDTYPVGGFASLSNRGSLESLLHSQLAYMEPAGAAARPDLFDVKYLRDELLYYSRDENQFLRRRRAFVVVLTPDLVRARFKDVDLPTQRIVLALGLLVAAGRRLVDWLSDDALVFDFAFVGEAGAQALTQERDLLAMVFREALANGTVRLIPVEDLRHATAVCRERARRSTCHALVVGVEPPAIEADAVTVARLSIDGPIPILVGNVPITPGATDDPIAAWEAVLLQLLVDWA